MLKLISDKAVNFFRKATIRAPKVETLRMHGALHSDFMSVNIVPYKPKKCTNIRNKVVLSSKFVAKLSCLVNL